MFRGITCGCRLAVFAVHLRAVYDVNATHSAGCTIALSSQLRPFPTDSYIGTDEPIVGQSPALLLLAECMGGLAARFRRRVWDRSKVSGRSANNGAGSASSPALWRQAVTETEELETESMRHRSTAASLLASLRAFFKDNPAWK